MSDNNDLLNQSEEMLSKLEEENPVQKEVSNVGEINSIARLKGTIFEFFIDHLKDVSKQEQLRERIADSFLNDLENTDEPLTFQERMSLYKLIAGQSNNSTDSVLGLFKPAPGTPSILAENLSKEDDKKDVFDDFFSELKPEEREKMNELTKFLKRLESEVKVEDE